MAREIEVMIAAVVIAVLVMMLAAASINAFIERHPTMKMLALSFLLLIGVVLIADGCGQLVSSPSLGAPAFPGAEGYGANSVGGRPATQATQVYVVRSLCDYDPVVQSPWSACGNPGYQHTLRWAINQTHPRIIVFDISGNIVLRHPLHIESQNSFLTIAGGWSGHQRFWRGCMVHR